MTEGENGRIRAHDEQILKAMSVEEFFMKLLIFKERLEIRVNQIKQVTK